MLRLRSFLFLLRPLALGAICALASYLAAGPTAGLFFGGFAFATLLTPLLLLRTDEMVEQLLTPIAVILGTVVVWGVAVTLEADLTLKEWGACSLILVCYLSAICGTTSVIRAARVPPIAAAVGVTVLSALWLTWPIWLSPALAGHEHIVAWLTPAHPLLAVDTVASLGSPWTEHRLMYNQLSILNQDVAYSTPSTILWTCGVHASLAAVMFTTAWLTSGRLPPINHHRRPSRRADHPASI